MVSAHFGEQGSRKPLPRVSLSCLENKNPFAVAVLCSQGGRSADGDVHTPALGVLIKPNPKRAGGPREQGEAVAWICSVGRSRGVSRSARDGKDCPGWILLVSLWFEFVHVTPFSAESAGILPGNQGFPSAWPFVGRFCVCPTLGVLSHPPGAAWSWPSRPASCFLEDTWKMPQIHEEQSILLGEIRGCLICPLPSLTTGRTGVRLLQVRSHLLEANPA